MTSYFARLLALALLPLALLTMPAVAQAQARRAADWTATVTLQPNGAFLLGNPDAKNRLVEYFSYTCPHCADFAGQPTVELKSGWVKSGRLAIEYRNYVRDPFDLSAAVIARCGGAPRFLGNHEAVFGNFEAWIAQAQAYQPSEALVQSRDRAAQILDIAEKTGLIALVGKHGVTPAAARACLANKEVIDTVIGLTRGADAAIPNFGGTPSFMLDGKGLDNVHDWSRLRPLLPALPASGN